MSSASACQYRMVAIWALTKAWIFCRLAATSCVRACFRFLIGWSRSKFIRGSLLKVAKKGDTCIVSNVALLVANSHRGSQSTQSSWWWLKYRRRLSSMVALKRSVWPSVCRWKPVLKHRSIPNCSHSAFQNKEANCGPWSEITVLSRPWYFQTLCKKRLARSSDEHVELQGTMWQSLVKRSTTIQMVSYAGLCCSPTMKSMLRFCHGASGMVFGFATPNCDWRMAFDLWQGW